MKYFYLIATGIGLLTTIYYKCKKSILIEKLLMTRDQSTQTLISLDRNEGILVKETILNCENKWYDIID